MPGRVSSRSTRSSAGAVSHKSSSQTLRSTRPSGVELVDEGPVTSLRTQVCTIFSDAQRSAAIHRKSVVALRKIQEYCCYEPVTPANKTGKKKGANQHGAMGGEEFDEEEFNNEVVRCVLRIMPVKKSEPVGDKVVRFLGLFLKHASDKDSAINNNAHGDGNVTEMLADTPTTRLTTLVLAQMLQLLPSKDKIVRFRATQIIAYIVNTLDFIDDELFGYIRLGLLKRLRDKESAVRVQAVHGLGRLAGEGSAEDANSDEDDEDGDTAQGILEKLLDCLQNDPSADVRRTLLLNLPLTPTTLPYLLERARDTDAATRRALYARLLPALGDFRHLSLTHREKLLRWGLRDRDDAVRKATARLFRDRWIEDCAATAAQAAGAGEQEQTEGADGVKAPEKPGPSWDALLELLERVDVINAGSENGIGLEAMHEFWDGRPDYWETVSFDDAFWAELSPESSFVLRTFNDYCRKSEDSRTVSMLEDKMPEVTTYGYLLQREILKLSELVKKFAEQDEANNDGEEDTEQQAFIVEQLLQVALTLDFTDEIGRRKMFSLMRESLTMPELPDGVTELLVEVLRSVCGSRESGEREFCSVVLEAIAEVHDTIMGEDQSQAKNATPDVDDSFHSAKSEVTDQSTPKGKQDNDGDMEMEDAGAEDPEDEAKAYREIMVNMKCLHIAQCMLQNVQCALEQNESLVTMLNNLVVPAVRSQEKPVRERGLLCLGLCCLLGKNLAQENLTLFLHCFAKGHKELQIVALQTITDILTTYPSLLAPVAAENQALPSVETPNDTSETNTNELFKPVLKTFTRALRAPEPSVQAIAVESLSKLLLSQTLSDPSLLQALLVLFFHPDSASNPKLRQTLSYFLPVYARCRTDNATRIVAVIVPVLRELVQLAEELEEDGESELGGASWVGVTGAGALMADWTDPRKALSAEREETATVTVSETGLIAPPAKKEIDGAVHLLLAQSLLERLVERSCSREERKPLISTFGKLALLASHSQADLPRIVLGMIETAIEARIATDATSRNALTKAETALRKIVDVATPGTPSDPDAELDADVEDDATRTGPTLTGTTTTTTTVPTGVPISATQSRRTTSARQSTATTRTRRSSAFPTAMSVTGLGEEEPDAEGTVFAFDGEDDEDLLDDEDELAGAVRPREEDEIVESLLESWVEEQRG